jgi:hypothetical protein
MPSRFTPPDRNVCPHAVFKHDQIKGGREVAQKGSPCDAQSWIGRGDDHGIDDQRSQPAGNIFDDRSDVVGFIGELDDDQQRQHGDGKGGEKTGPARADRPGHGSDRQDDQGGEHGPQKGHANTQADSLRIFTLGMPRKHQAARSMPEMAIKGALIQLMGRKDSTQAASP